MAVVVEVITALEKTPVTKEVLEHTRLGKYINELRRKTQDNALAKRAKDLVRRWRHMLLPSSAATATTTPVAATQQVITTPVTTSGSGFTTCPVVPPTALNGAATAAHNAALRSLKPHSPISAALVNKNLKSQSPLLKNLPNATVSIIPQ